MQVSTCFYTQTTENHLATLLLMQADWHILPRIQKYIDSGMRYAYSILQQQQYRHADSVYTNDYFGTPTTSRSEIVAASDMAGAILTLCCLH